MGALWGEEATGSVWKRVFELEQNNSSYHLTNTYYMPALT